MEEAKVHSYIPTLNGWRAFSILYVLLYHSTWIFFNPETGLLPNETLWAVTKQGAFGVYFFFGISGFLITTRLIEEHHFFGNISIKAFYLRRVFRIFPILLAFLLIIFILKSNQLINTSDRAIWSSLLFFRNYTSDTAEWFTGHFWSLSMEEHYYLIWPALFYFIIKCKRPWLPTAILILAVTLWRMIEYRYHILAPHLATTEFRARTDLFIDYIAWGSLAAFLNSISEFKDAFLKFFKSWMIIIALCFIHILLFVKFPLPDTLKAITIQICILLTVNFPSARFSKFLENKYIATIGLYSYSLYVWQQLVFTPADQRIPGITFLQTPPLNIIVLIFLVYISYNFLEIPSINFGKTLLKKMKLFR